ncbi:MAG: hypothetical protein M0C28_06940 [Candidatus Moduliflexus flocculans]|nr:hypothetical protein [Candidatus Moduliflexus flocculans]
MMADLLMFHGRECPHCHRMMPRVEQLEAETGVRFDKREVWHDEANQDLMRSYQDVLKAKCGGQLRVPAFLNPGEQGRPLRRSRLREAQGLGPQAVVASVRDVLRDARRGPDGITAGRFADDRTLRSAQG